MCTMYILGYQPWQFSTLLLIKIANEIKKIRNTYWHSFQKSLLTTYIFIIFHTCNIPLAKVGVLQDTITELSPLITALMSAGALGTRIQAKKKGKCRGYKSFCMDLTDIRVLATFQGRSKSQNHDWYGLIEVNFQIGPFFLCISLSLTAGQKI